MSALSALLLGLGALGVATASTASAAAPSNDNLANATAVSGVPSVVEVDNTSATLETGQQTPPDCPGLTHDVWYRYTPTATGTLAVTTRASATNRDTVVAVWSGPATSPAVGGLTYVTCNDDIASSGSVSHVDASVTAGTTYYIQVASYGSDVGAFEVQFGQGPTTTTLSATQSNRAVTLRASVAPVAGLGTASGTVQFFEGATPLTPVRSLSRAGATELTLTNVSLGTHTYHAVYTPTTVAGNVINGYATSTSTDQAVNVTASPTTDLVATLTGRQVALQASVTVNSGDPAPTGTVEFRDGGTTVATATLDGTGAASATVSGLTVGNHTFRAVYLPTSGSSYVTSSSADRTVTVQAAPTSTLAATAAGRSVTLSVTVAGVSGDPYPTGSVTFLEGARTVGTGVLDGTGRAGVVLAGVGLGQHTYHATYTPASGSNFLAGDSNFASVTVTSAPATTLAAHATGQSVVLQAAVNGAAGEAQPTGTVQFFDGTTQVGSAALGNGGATTTLSGVAPGTHSYSAVYVPSAGSTYTGSRSSAVSVVVGATTTTIKAPAKAKAGSRPKITVEVTTADGSAAAGTVTVTIKGKTVGTVTLSGGVGKVKLPKLKPGKVTITATYAGSSATAPSSDTSTIKVTKKKHRR